MAKKRVKKTFQQMIGLRASCKQSYAIPNPEKEANKKACRGKVHYDREMDY